jgi:hypothetical protein
VGDVDGVVGGVAARRWRSSEPTIVDTGTTLIAVPQPVVAKTLATINASQGFQALFGTNQRLARLDAPSQGCVTQAGVTADMIDAMMPALTLTVPGMAGAGDATITVSASNS